MGLGIGAGEAGHFIAAGAILLLGRVADGLRGARDGAGGAQDVFGDAEAFVAETAIPGVEEFLFMLHGDVHGVGNFAAVLPEIDAAGHGDGPGDAQVHGFVPEGELMAHVFEDAATGIIPEIAPVDEAVGIERMVRRFAQESLPMDVLGRHVGVDGAGPLRLAVRGVAVHAGLDEGDFAHEVGIEEAGGVGGVAAGIELVADLHHAAVGGILESGAHLLGVVHRESHGLFEVDVLAGVDGGEEMLIMEMRWSGDDNSIDGRIFEQTAVVEVGLGGGRNGAGFLQAARVDVGDPDAFGVGAGEDFAEEFSAAGAGAEDAEADAVAGAEDAGRGQRAGQAGGNFADEITARLHEKWYSL